MMHLKNFKEYIPTDPDKVKLKDEAGVLFIRSDDGSDWYDSQKKFASDTIKITYDSDGIVTSTSKNNSCHNVDKLWPLNRSVLELPNTPENLEIDNSAGWIVEDGIVKKRIKTKEDKIADTEYKKKTLYNKAKSSIEPLVFANDIGSITPEETILLNSYKKYLVELYRIDTNSEDIVWPEIP